MKTKPKFQLHARPGGPVIFAAALDGFGFFCKPWANQPAKVPITHASWTVAQFYRMGSKTMHRVCRELSEPDFRSLVLCLQSIQIQNPHGDYDKFAAIANGIAAQRYLGFGF